jgi:1-acyl-sn-glycerol-3-phosphate acyltransferase
MQISSACCTADKRGLLWSRAMKPEPLGGTLLLAQRLGALARSWWLLRQPWRFGRLPPSDLHTTALSLRTVTARLCADNGMEVETRGPRPPAGCVLVANHLSYIDTLILPSLIHGTVIAKREVLGWPVIGQMVKQLGVLFVERDSPWSGALVLRQAMRAVSAGLTLVAFPEGSTTRGDQLLPFKRGVFGLARRLGVPVVAASISYQDPGLTWTGDEEFLGHYVDRVARKRRTAVRLTFSAPFDSRAWPSATALADGVRRHIAETLASPWERRAPLTRRPAVVYQPTL